MNHEVPEFESNIPAHLLTNASPQDKYIMENISILSQKSNWLTQTQKLQSQDLGELKVESKEIRIQTTKTNGRVTVLEEQVRRVQAVVALYATVKGFFKKKLNILLFGLSVVVFFSYVAPWIQAHGKDLIENIVKLIFG